MPFLLHRSTGATYKPIAWVLVAFLLVVIVIFTVFFFRHRQRRPRPRRSPAPAINLSPIRTPDDQRTERRRSVIPPMWRPSRQPINPPRGSIRHSLIPQFTRRWREPVSPPVVSFPLSTRPALAPPSQSNVHPIVLPDRAETPLRDATTRNEAHGTRDSPSPAPTAKIAPVRPAYHPPTSASPPPRKPTLVRPDRAVYNMPTITPSLPPPHGEITATIPCARVATGLTQAPQLLHTTLRSLNLIPSNSPSPPPNTRPYRTPPPPPQETHPALHAPASTENFSHRRNQTHPGTHPGLRPSNHHATSSDPTNLSTTQPQETPMGRRNMHGLVNTTYATYLQARTDGDPNRLDVAALVGSEDGSSVAGQRDSVGGGGQRVAGPNLRTLRERMEVLREGQGGGGGPPQQQARGTRAQESRGAGTEPGGSSSRRRDEEARWSTRAWGRFGEPRDESRVGRERDGGEGERRFDLREWLAEAEREEVAPKEAGKRDRRRR